MYNLNFNSNWSGMLINLALLSNLMLVIFFFFAKCPQFLLRRDVTHFFPRTSISLAPSLCPIICPADTASRWFSRRETGCFAFTAGAWRLLASAMNNWFPPEAQTHRAKGFYFQASPLENTTIDFSRRLFRTRDCTFVVQRLSDEEEEEEEVESLRGEVSEPGWVQRGTDRHSSSQLSRTGAANITSNGSSGAESRAWKCSGRVSLGSFQA